MFVLLLTEGLNSHYCLTTIFQDLMHTLCQYPRITTKGAGTKFSVNCMQSFGKQKNSDHVRLCEDNQPLRLVMPN